MLIYSQSTGIISRNGLQLGHGWAGNDFRPIENPTGIQGKNNPAMQFKHKIGPLPQGFYTLDGWEPEHARLGPWVCHLTPDPENDMQGDSDAPRDEFYMHGPDQDPAKYGHESEGCIVLLRADRMSVKTSGDTRLQVVA